MFFDSSFYTDSLCYLGIVTKYERVGEGEGGQGEAHSNGEVGYEPRYGAGSSTFSLGEEEVFRTESYII